LRLNLANCSFGLKSRNLLGFVVSDRGIEVNPNKVKAIQSLSAPKIERGKDIFKEIELYCLVYISANNNTWTNLPITEENDPET